MARFAICLGQACLATVMAVSAVPAAEFIGSVVDADSGAPLPARVYLQNEDGEWLFVASMSPDGSAQPYLEQWVPMADSVERHTTVSAHPFRVDLQPGRYSLLIERGKEFFPLSATITMANQPRRQTFRIRRWIDMASQGWYSGETHVHRRIRELPNVQLAEDLNVAFPVTFWTIDAFSPPGLAPSPLRRQGPSPWGPRQDLGHEMISIDDTHVMFPRNTEYEIFSIKGRRHVLGAVFLLNHRTVFKTGMPPVRAIAETAHREGALLDLDKHNWPWSMMLVPIAKVDLFELSNNSVWRTKFGFRNTSTAPAQWMDIERDERGITERGWLNFGFANYYTLLNCGFRLQPTAGTASGVHPVPLGHGRVYVHLDGPFDGPKWIAQLRRGESFVTTGPMLFATVDGKRPGHEFRLPDGKPAEFRLTGRAVSERPLESIEVLVNGEVAATISPRNHATPAKANETEFSFRTTLTESSWIAVRCFETRPGGRVRFAHTAPWHIVIGDKPVRPRKREVDFLIRRVRDEIDRNRDLLPDEAMAEFHEALRIYEEIGRRAK